eukprot:3937181-Rhodomonas_salina.2
MPADPRVDNRARGGAKLFHGVTTLQPFGLLVTVSCVKRRTGGGERSDDPVLPAREPAGKMPPLEMVCGIQRQGQEEDDQRSPLNP